ncbi:MULTISPECIES: patatin-like phospholipase family protein [Thermotoga]|jgi:hypothetical protein|uniref:PNPLA domain-containing protein n=1 Tax=Thermotoga neapolitana (strain ATCC 49049 / DSM 4359 / NBRC 107923 / NS-E) TaxID=309803 RepID=B9KAR5_THENN|nr:MULTISPECIES: hypothetical protein [Thermotoga]ACM24048.1 Putative uncharacterized protein [Thermotoga neapolitana DSM 4359]AJG40070.1 hypothetical protein TRQ7_01105 [Thermotoga sp. RQ7]KFZ20840.1 hypothetical protein LA10_09964 [Thermotoga neapolitana LA10]MDK2785545.1 hypothetical protein [Thermotoga sp.]
MALVISFGGENGAYLGSIGVLKALKEMGKDDVMVRCCGLSAVPCGLFFLTRSPNRTYSILVREWRNLEKLLNPFFSRGIDRFSMFDALRILMRVGDSLNGVRNHERLYRYVDRLFPAQKIPAGLEIWVFDLLEGKEVVFGEGNDLREAVKASLSFPILYRPYRDRYVPLSWVTGVPEGDVIVSFELKEEAQSPRNALDYLFLSTIARTKKIEKTRMERAKQVLRVECSSHSPAFTARRAYERALELFGG